MDLNVFLNVKNYFSNLIKVIINKSPLDFSLENWLILIILFISIIFIFYLLIGFLVNGLVSNKIGVRTPVLNMENNTVLNPKDLNVSFQNRVDKKIIKEIFLPKLLPFIPSQKIEEKKIIYILDSELFKIDNPNVDFCFFNNIIDLENEINNKKISKNSWLYININEEIKKDGKVFNAKDLSVKLINNGFKNIKLYTINSEKDELNCCSKEEVLEELNSLREVKYGK